MTLLCSPKVTQHHSEVNAHLSPGKAVFGRGQITRGPQRRYIPQLDLFIGPQIVCSKVSNLRTEALVQQLQQRVVRPFNEPNDDVAIFIFLDCAACGHVDLAGAFQDLIYDVLIEKQIDFYLVQGSHFLLLENFRSSRSNGDLVSPRDGAFEIRSDIVSSRQVGRSHLTRSRKTIAPPQHEFVAPFSL
jgi:hypothetical protein